MVQKQKGEVVEVQESPVQEKETDQRLLSIQALDEIIHSKSQEVSRLEDRMSNLETQTHSMEQDLDRKRRESEFNLRLRAETFEDELIQAKSSVEVRERQVEMIERNLADREAQVVIKEEQMAEFEKERKEFQDIALGIQQAEMTIQDRLNEAEGLKVEYEAQIASLLPLQAESQNALAQANLIQEQNRERMALIELREKTLLARELSFKEAQKAFRRKMEPAATTNGQPS